MSRLIILLVLPLLSGCFATPLTCRLEAIGVSGNVADEDAMLIGPQAAVVDLTHSPDGCLVAADIRVVGPGGEDCEVRAVADQPRPEGGLSVTSLTVRSTGDCGWPASVNGESVGTGGSYIELDGIVDFSEVDGDNVCVTGSVRLEIDTTLTGNSSETLLGTYTFTEGLISVENRSGTCPAE